MSRIFAGCVFVVALAFILNLSWLVSARPLAAQSGLPSAPVVSVTGPPVVSVAPAPADALEETPAEAIERAFNQRYGYNKGKGFNPRARAVVNPHPSPRPRLLAGYPKRGNVSGDSMRRWELGLQNWTRVSNAYYGPVTYGGGCGPTYCR